MCKQSVFSNNLLYIYKLDVLRMLFCWESSHGEDKFSLKRISWEFYKILDTEKASIVEILRENGDKTGSKVLDLAILKLLPFFFQSEYKKLNI